MRLDARPRASPCASAGCRCPRRGRRRRAPSRARRPPERRDLGGDLRANARGERLPVHQRRGHLESEDNGDRGGSFRDRAHGPTAPTPRASAWLRSLGIGLWRLGERLGINVVGATEVPRAPRDETRIATFEQLIATARAGDGIVDTAACPYPVHELLTHLVDRHGLLLHGSNHTTLETARAAAGKGPGHHAARRRRLRRRHLADVLRRGRARSRRRRDHGLHAHGPRIAPAPLLPLRSRRAPATGSTFTDGVVYALPRAGFRCEWGNEWVSPDSVRPQLRIHVRPADFPLLDTVVELASPLGVRQVIRRLRAAKRERAATP